MTTKINYRQMVELFIGCKLKSIDIVHHINGRRNKNTIENFYIYDSNREHVIYHIKVGTIAMGLFDCYSDKCIVEYVRKRILHLKLNSNVFDKRCENKGGSC